MISKHFVLRLGLRIALLAVLLTAFVAALINSGYHATTFLALTLTTLSLFELHRHVSVTNAELTRFLNAVHVSDFSQRFNAPVKGASFEPLEKAFTDILDQFKTAQGDKEKDLQRLKAMIEHTPVPLISLHLDQHISLHNHSARRLFGNVKVNALKDLEKFGSQLAHIVETIEPGNHQLVTMSYDGVSRQLMLVATQVVSSGRQEKLISLQDIQGELDDAQLQAWQDLTRVLTHEIINSITPVASLAKTALHLVDDSQRHLKDSDDKNIVQEELNDASNALETLAKRSDNLMQFVQSYRDLMRLPPPKKQSINLQALFSRLTELFSSGWSEKGIDMQVSVTPQSLELVADSEMLEQVLINLLQNAEQALINTPSPAISLTAQLSVRGQIVIEVSDNGPGVPADIATKVFVPFFTTKREGSGIGLALARQIMTAHGATIALTKSDKEGAQFTLTF